MFTWTKNHIILVIFFLFSPYLTDRHLQVLWMLISIIDFILKNSELGPEDCVL